MRPPIIVKNTDKNGRVSDQWYVRIGKKWRLFDQEAWENGGIEWINEQLVNGAGK